MPAAGGVLPQALPSPARQPQEGGRSSAYFKTQVWWLKQTPLQSPMAQSLLLVVEEPCVKINCPKNFHWLIQLSGIWLIQPWC